MITKVTCYPCTCDLLFLCACAVLLICVSGRAGSCSSACGWLQTLTPPWSESWPSCSARVRVVITLVSCYSCDLLFLCALVLLTNVSGPVCLVFVFCVRPTANPNYVLTWPACFVWVEVVLCCSCVHMHMLFACVSIPQAGWFLYLCLLLTDYLVKDRTLTLVC